MSNRCQSGIAELCKSELAEFNNPKVLTSCLSHLNVILCLAEFFIQRLFFPDMLMKTNSHVTQRQTPCGEFSLRTLADGLPFPSSFVHSCRFHLSFTYSDLPGDSPALFVCSREHWHGFFASMKSLKWDWLFNMATTPSLTRYTFAYSLNYSVDLRDICTVKL